ncbi:MAG TPA: helicase-exonuclease AddAB subunit AddB [Bacilli bacterium]
MPIQFIVGRSGSGKTAACLAAIQNKLTAEPFGSPLIMLVPEQATFQTEVKLATTPGVQGVIRAQVLSFRRLAHRVLQETGGLAGVPISETGKKMLLYRILRQSAGQLRIYRNAERAPGLIDRFLDMFNELKRYLVSAAELRAHAGKYNGFFAERANMLPDKLHDLALIYEQYEEALAGHYSDGEDLLNKLAANAKASGMLANAEIWIDGFHGFTPQEYAVLRELMQICRDIHLTICADREYAAGEQLDELNLFYPGAATMVKLKEMAAELGVRVEKTVCLTEHPSPRFAARPVLSHLERHFSRMRAYPEGAKTQGLRLYAAVHRQAEVEGAAREMIRLVRDEGYRFRDMVVMIRDEEHYRHLLENVLTDYGIPYFFDAKKHAAHHPVVEFIRSALEVVTHNWRYEAVFRCVKTDLLLPLNERHEPAEGDRLRALRNRMDRLENVVLAFGVSGAAKWTDPAPWNVRMYRSLEDETPEAENPAALEELIHRDRLRIAEPLRQFQQAMANAAHVKEMVEAVFALLMTLQVPRKLEVWANRALAAGNPEEARTHTAVWGAIVDTLDQLVETMGDDTISIGMFANVLETGLEAIRLSLVPPSLDQVLIGNADRTRPADVRCCFLLGVSEGVYPAKTAEGGALSETERDWLARTGMKLAPGSTRKLLDEQFVFYTLVTLPSEQLWLSFPLADEEGKALLPAPFMRRVARMFPTLTLRQLAADPTDEPAERQTDYIVRPGNALTCLLVHLRRWKAGEEMPAVWWQVYNWFAENKAWREKLARLTPGLAAANVEKPLRRETALKLYGSPLITTVSRMEQFAACPFAHFAAYGLRLKERKIYRLQAPDVGVLFHGALRKIGVDLLNMGKSWGDLTPADCQAWAAKAVEALAPKLQGEILLSSNRYKYIARKLRDTVGQTAAALSEQARRGEFVPYGFELKFGPAADVPALSIPLAGGATAEIAGQIDRIDRARLGEQVYYRIIDYKSGKATLDYTEIYHGLALQLLTYLDAIVSYAESSGEYALPAGAFYFHVHNPLINGRIVSAEAAQRERFKRFKMDGLVLADRDIIRLMDRDLTGHSAIIPVNILKSGELGKSSKTFAPEQWRALRRHLHDTFRRIGSEITAGNVDLKVYGTKAEHRCAGCPFKAVCQIDPQTNPDACRQLRRFSKDEFWRALAETAADSEYGTIGRWTP